MIKTTLELHPLVLATSFPLVWINTHSENRMSFRIFISERFRGFHFDASIFFKIPQNSGHLDFFSPHLPLATFLPYAAIPLHSSSPESNQVEFYWGELSFWSLFIWFNWTGRFLRAAEIHSQNLKASMASCFLGCYFSIRTQFQNQLDYFIFLWFYKYWTTFIHLALLALFYQLLSDGMEDLNKNIHFIFFFKRLNAVRANIF